MTAEEIIDTMKEIERLTEALGYSLLRSEYRVEDWGCPHKPKMLPKNHAAVYMFFKDDRAWKIGKANKNSQARYLSQHYGFGAPSTLAKSIRDDDKIVFPGKEDQSVMKAWIENNLQRINILIHVEEGKDEKAITELVETVMHYKYRPRYEGAISRTEE